MFYFDYLDAFLCLDSIHLLLTIVQHPGFYQLVLCHASSCAMPQQV